MIFSTLAETAASWILPSRSRIIKCRKSRGVPVAVWGGSVGVSSNWMGRWIVVDFIPHLSCIRSFTASFPPTAARQRFDAVLSETAMVKAAKSRSGSDKPGVSKDRTPDPPAVSSAQIVVGISSDKRPSAACVYSSVTMAIFITLAVGKTASALM